MEEAAAGGAEAVGGDQDQHKVIKMRLKHLVSDQRLVARIRYAVDTMHEVVSRAMIFGKLLYMADLAREVAASSGIFGVMTAARMAAVFPIDNDQMEEWLDVVSSPLQGRIGRPYAPAKVAHLERLHAFYATAANHGLLPTTKLPCTNLSSPKGHAAAQLAVNYRNNVHCHFDKYVKRFVQVQLTGMARAELGLLPEAKLPVPTRCALATDIRAVCNDLLQSSGQLRCRDGLHGWLDQHRDRLVPPKPIAAAPTWRFYSQKKYPERWLPYMVSINAELEAAGAKLLSPLPQRRSFVPAHIRLDTTGLTDLLVADGDETLVLKAKLEGMDMPGGGGSTEVHTKYSLPGLLVVSEAKKAAGEAPKPSKGKLYVDLAKLVAPSLVARVRLEPAKHASAFKTALWRCLTKLGTNKHAVVDHVEMVFNNVIDLDGHSASVHYVTPSLHGLTRFNGGFKKLKASQKAQVQAEKAKGARYVTTLSEQERMSLLEEGVRLSVDPGKGNLACVTDGMGKVASYTAAQRRFESGSKAHAREHQRLLDVRHEGARTARELLRSIGLVQVAPGEPDIIRSAKSTIQAHYDHYLLTRSAVAAELSKFYRRPVFRQHRYDAHVGRRSSEDRFFSRVKRTFGTIAVVLYGDWGRAPNIPHQPPSPGVGLRRRFCSHFEVNLVHEPYTSSVCPRCLTRGMMKPRKDQADRDVHHLLKCPNGLCSCRWWNRDILGALNILKTGEHALRTGQWHPAFASAPAA